MKLTETDRRFVTDLAGENAERVLSMLEQRSEVLVSMGAAARPRTLAQDIAAYARLALRLARGALRRSGASGAPGVFVERAPSATPARDAYVRRFRSDAAYFPVSSATSMVFPRGGRRRGARAMGALLRAILSADRSVVSELASSYVDVVTSCLMVSGHARASRGGEALLFRPYRLEVPFVASYLLAEGMRALPVVGTTPMAAHVRTLVGSSAVLCTAYQVDEFAHFQPLGPQGRFELWGPTELVEMERRYGDAEPPQGFDMVGVYTQGFWLRVLQGSIDEASARPHLELERRFLGLLERYAREHPEIAFMLFPHPQERARYAKTGEHGYGSLLALSNVGFDPVDESSLVGFDQVGLGVTTVSTVGFDRLHIGRRTIFLVGENDFIDLDVPSRYSSVFHTEEGPFIEHLERARRQRHDDFMAEHFGDAYDGLWGPWCGRSASGPEPSDDDNAPAHREERA